MTEAFYVPLGCIALTQRWVGLGAKLIVLYGVYFYPH